MLSCSCYDGDDSEWMWTDSKEVVLKTKRGRRCCSCNKMIKPGDVAVRFLRSRDSNTDIEERIHGDEVPLASWFMCEECGDLFWALDELGFCISLGDASMKSLVREYNEIYGRGLI